MSRFLPLALLLAAGPATAASTFPVDDSRSHVQSPLVRTRWEDPVPGRGSNAVIGQLTVVARLDVSPWRGREGRIYLTLPPQAFDALTASWTTHGRLLPGTVRSGQRTLVYAGPIATDEIEDVLLLTLKADGSRLFRTEAVEFRFEIDVDTP
ncbi:hypothetical protein ACFOED_05700 [Vulcaniibacterium thermophilum]|uniref:Uncharacterized protein n=1 Tax=Vulcaniibacterium thermophilum TaxID=1169913 RepID=A0A918YV42_9GAMM|nr:hypothetical protein [Vulcaniibacterium thermophilum]GHE25118.1 hypothetical protein GCM10007167_01480 [Vulcaniibacterium thermophilum]